LDDFQRDLIALLPRLRRFARALARDPADADDLVQVAIERALQRSTQWSPGTRLDSWMFRIVKNVWIDETRARQRRRRVFEEESAGESVAGADASSVEARLLGSEIVNAMARLPEEQRLAVALVLVDGMSYRDAADALQIPEGTLTSRLVRGRNALMAQLEHP